MPRLIPVHWRDLERVVLKKGFQFVRQRGSHRSYVRPGALRPIVIPQHTEIPVSIIKATIDTLGISREEFLALLHE